jgi:alanine racemase
MENRNAYSTWVEIDLTAIVNNVGIIHQQTGVQVMAVVKADGYGHGAAPVARAALRGGASWLAVARLEEALELRQAGLEAPILLLGYTPPARLAEAISSNLSLAAWTDEQVEAAAAAARNLGSVTRLHLKVDTGMHRIGAQPEAALQLAWRIARTQGAHLEGVFTHFARADEADLSHTLGQIARFRQLLSHLEAAGLRPPLAHAANSATSLTLPESSFDMVRLGIAMYGLHPSPDCPLPGGFRPALSWKTVLSHIKTVPPGQGISYNYEYITQAHERIGTLPVGYADGLRRKLPNQVLIQGLKLPVVGRVCMDQVMVLLDGAPESQIGDEVVIIGEQRGQRISAEEVGQRWGTINYDVVCGIGRRVPRVYLGQA